MFIIEHFTLRTFFGRDFCGVWRLFQSIETGKFGLNGVFQFEVAVSRTLP